MHGKISVIFVELWVSDQLSTILFNRSMHNINGNITLVVVYRDIS